MRDNEIIKADEIIKALNGADVLEHICIYCADNNGEDVCTIKLIDIIDLINRQQAEIERLEKGNKEQKAIIEAIEDSFYPLPFETDFSVAMKNTKSEAIKEFAENVVTALDERVSENIRNLNPHWYIAKRIVRETAIEMTE